MLADGDRLLVIASNMGAEAHPDWYLNLVADPRVIVEIGDGSYEARAVPAEGTDREHLWARLVAAYPFFADHQQGIARTIPVVVLVLLFQRRIVAGLTNGAVKG